MVRSKKERGAFFTPTWVVDFMVGLVDVEDTHRSNTRHSGRAGAPNHQEHDGQGEYRILEPGCGPANFLKGILRNRPHLYNRSELYGVEVDEGCEAMPGVHVEHGDYLLWEPQTRFDLVIGNPPYGIPSHTTHYAIRIDRETRERYKRVCRTWFGKYNLYGAFTEKSVSLLKEGGQLLFIVPATFMVLDEFKKLRAFLAESGSTSITYIGPGVFRPEAQVTTAVLDFRKSASGPTTLALYEYDGASDKGKRCLVYEKAWEGELITFEDEQTVKLERVCSLRLSDLYEIRISPRSTEIKRCKYAKRVDEYGGPSKPAKHLPILDGKSLRPGFIEYDKYDKYDKYDERTPHYRIAPEHVGLLREYFTRPRVVVGHTKGGRVEAALDYRSYPWMGDVYHLLPKVGNGGREKCMGDSELVEYLNSETVQRYMRGKYRQITPHVTSTQLRALPLPTSEEWERLRAED